MTRLICMLAFDNAQSLDVCGPLEVFALASRQALEDGETDMPLYETRLIAPRPGAIRFAAGLRLLPDFDCTDAPADIHTLLISGGMSSALDVQRADTSLVAWLRAMGARVPRLASVCNGALLLAETGLLDGREATTHWRDLGELRARYPLVQIVDDAIYTRSDHIWTSAGVTAGMDLALAMVAADHGQPLASRIARRLVLATRRSGGQAQISPQLQALTQADAFGELAQWMRTNLRARLDAASLAARVHVGARQFNRRFKATFGTTPHQYVERLRVDSAQAMLEHSPRDLKRIADECGFSSEEAMRRSFVRQTGLRPHDYRRKFRSGA